MNTKVTYGFILAASGIVFQLIKFLLGMEVPKASGIDFAGILFGLAALVLSFVILYFGIRAVRDEKPDQSLTFGQGVAAGVIIALVGGLVAAVYTVVHFTLINPGFAEHAIAAARLKWEAQGMPDRSMEAAEKIMRIVMNPGILAVSGFFGTMLFGTVFSLIIAAIVKREPKPALPIDPSTGAIPPPL